MIRLEYCRQPRLLLANYGEAIEQVPLDLFNALLARFVAREGTADMIVDLSAAPAAAETRAVLARGLLPSIMLDRRRIFVVGDDVHHELIQLYRLYQERIGMPMPAIVDSLSQALESRQSGPAGFAPWPERDDG